MVNRLLLLLLSVSLLLGNTGSLMAQARMSFMQAEDAHASAATTDLAADADCHRDGPPGDHGQAPARGDDMHDDEHCLQLCMQLCLHSCPAVSVSCLQFPAPTPGRVLLPNTSPATLASPSSPPIRPPIA